MAAAIGAGLPVQDASGSMIVDIGGGTTEVAVISLGGVVAAKSLRTAGNEMDEDIIQFARDSYNLLLGERTAEEIKIAIGSAYQLKEPLETVMRGRDLVTGLPKEIKVNDQEIRKAVSRSVRTIITAIKDTIEATPPELVADIMKKGIIMTGGGSLLKEFPKLVQEQTQMPTHLANDPRTCVVRGCGVVLEDLDALKEVLLTTQYEKPIR
jgi:rod shape-determining protein MreB